MTTGGVLIAFLELKFSLTKDKFLQSALNYGTHTTDRRLLNCLFYPTDHTPNLSRLLMATYSLSKTRQNQSRRTMNRTADN
jgi:hypothetical protein